MKIKVSVIIPVYNVEKYLKKCLDSVINQTLKEIEIIIVNDGSTDSSLKICQEYEQKDKRIHLINQKNSGLGIARNNAIKYAQGEFVCFLDSDDSLDLVTLQTTYNKANKDKSDIVVFGFERIDETTNRIIQTRDDLHSDLNILNNKQFFSRVISANFKHMVCSMIIKRNLFITYNLKFPAALHEDLYVVPQLFYYAKKTSFIYENYYKWLIRKNSITSTITQKHIDGIITAIFYIKSFLLKENILNTYKSEFTRFYLIYLTMLFNRIKSLSKNKNIKNELIKLLYLKAYSLINLNDINHFKYENEKRFKEFISMYKTFLKEEKNNDLEISNILLIQQLNEIKSSRGYKFLLKYYHYRDKILPHGSFRRKTLKKIANFILKKEDLSINIKKNNITKNIKAEYYDVVFLPHKDYHVWTMGLIARELKKRGINSCLMDLTDYYRDEGSRNEAKNFQDIPFLDFNFLRVEKIDYKALICMNDWDKKIVRPEVIKAKKKNKITIGIVEGVQDFLDLDTKQNRQPYKTVEYVFLTGKHDKQFFRDKNDKTFIIGIPRLKKLLNIEPKFPKEALAVINLNFSYNVLSDKAKVWLDSAIEGCKLANIDYIITQHPADKTNLENYNVTNKTMYEIIEEGSIVISRFGSTIIEALAMGKPCIYHNPHNEKVIKFQEPMGAYSLSFDSKSLAEAIRYELSLDVDYRKRANKFLDYHCNINSKESSAFLSAKIIKIIIES
jgi:glycosyltransferase involved in cell wall biosynthesis